MIVPPVGEGCGHGRECRASSWIRGMCGKAGYLQIVNSGLPTVHEGLTADASRDAGSARLAWRESRNSMHCDAICLFEIDEPLCCTVAVTSCILYSFGSNGTWKTFDFMHVRKYGI